MYADAVKTLNAGLAFSEADRSTQQTVIYEYSSSMSTCTKCALIQARLAETGAKKIAQMFTTLVAESASSALLNPIIYLGVSPSDIPLLTRDQEDSLIPVVSSLRSLPTPTTHPSHPASSGNLKILNEAQDGYADMRGGWAKRCLEFRARELVRQAEDAANGIQISFQFAQWTEGLLLLAEVSRHFFVRRLMLKRYCLGRIRIASTICSSADPRYYCQHVRSTDFTYPSPLHEHYRCFPSSRQTFGSTVPLSSVFHLWLFVSFAGSLGLRTSSAGK